MSAESRPEGRYSVRAVERVADILDSLQRSSRGVSLVTLSEITGLPKSSVFRYLATLETRGYVEKDPLTGDFTLGVALPSQQRHFDALASRVRPTLERLRDRFGETVNLGALDGDRVLYVEIVQSQQAMRMAARRGERDYVHSTALGMAMAATLPDEDVRRILDTAGMPSRTSRTVTSAEAMLAELERVRAVGYAVDDEQNEEGARCVAVALEGTAVPAGISVSAPAVRFSREDADRVGEVLVDEAAFLVRRLRGPGAAEASGRAEDAEP